MDPMEQMLLRLRELQPEVPSWAKAEQMGRVCTACPVANPYGFALLAN